MCGILCIYPRRYLIYVDEGYSSLWLRTAVRGDRCSQGVGKVAAGPEGLASILRDLGWVDSSLRLGAVFWSPVSVSARLSRRGCRVPRARWCLSGRWDACCWSAGFEGLEPRDSGGDFASPGPAGGEAEPQPAAAGDDAPGSGEDPQPEPPGFPAAAGPGQGEHLGPGEQFAGQRHDLAPDLVLGVAVQGQVCAVRCLWRSGSCPRTGPPAYGVVPGQRAGLRGCWWRGR